MTRTIADITYSVTPQRPLRLDLRLPDDAQRPPLILYIPMGGMSSCLKANVPAWLVDYGFAVASIECRVSSEVPAPAPVYDCKSAIRWLRAHAGEHGYNPDAIGVWGHSAGGLLASLMATSSGRPELEGDGPHREVSSAVQAAIDCCGSPHDLAYFTRPGVATRFAGVTGNIDRYLGGPLAQKLDLARLVSPAMYVSPNCPPVFLIHGDRDHVVPLEETVMFHESLKAAGVDSTLLVLPGIGHSWDPAMVRPAVVGFFNRTLGAPVKR
ncbi:MAG: alpha/beta hydrolase [Planctomycetota bacterium]|nr:alpha/beta hydrolase [Planctomycetota bacterium]